MVKATRRVTLFRVGAVFALFGTVTLATVAVGASAALAATSSSQIVAQHSGKCLDVWGVSTDNGAPIQQWDCVGSGQTNQQFSLVRVGLSDFYQIVAQHSGKCLDSGVSSANGVRIVQSDCLGSGQTSQQFSFARVGIGNFYEIIARQSSKCLDVSDSSTDNGAPILQWDCHGQANQQFRLDLIT